MTGLPERQGLYDPRFEHDACGIGFVAHVGGVASHDVVAQALRLLGNMAHRGGAGCDPCTGDGAGVLLQLPHALLAASMEPHGVTLPAPGRYGVGMLFLPQDEAERHACELVLEQVVAEEGCAVLGWRDVPCAAEHIGDVARRSAPVIRQVFVDARRHLGRRAFERRLYIIRRQVENALGARGGFYVASLSSRTVVYKGLVTPAQLPLFYTDLADPRLASALALVHSRFSTNTFPTWARAHPYRFLCHNGEINTLRGNQNWMRVREGNMRPGRFGDDLQKLYPLVGEDQSDSACVDNVLEFLVQGGRSLPHAMMMLVPEAWEGNRQMDLDRRGFYEFHSAMMEAWDGPAAIAFTDGRRIGATLDRNGLRPGRWLVTDDDVVVLASEAGALDVPPQRVKQQGRLQPGRMFLVDTGAGRVITDDEIKRRVASRRPYRAWVATNRVGIDELPEPLALPQPDAAALRERQAAFGYTAEELRMVLAPMATSGEEPTGSMGSDTPLAVLSERPQLLFRYFRQLFAQVTNPPIDPIREQLVMSLATNIGPRANLHGEHPAQARRVRVKGPVLTNAQLDKIANIVDHRFRAKTLRMLFPASGGARALAQAVEALCRQAAQAIREGHTLLILSDRGVSADWAPIPSLLATSAVHHHLIREKLRTEAGLIVQTGEAREVAHFALLIGYGAGTVNPYLAFETLTDLARGGQLPEGLDEAAAHAKYIKAVEKGLLKILSKMGISTVQSYCGAQIFEALGLGPRLVERHFTGTPSRIGGIEMPEVAEETLRRHAAAFGQLDTPMLEPGGEYHWRVQGEHHHWNPRTVAALQHAATERSAEKYERFAELANAEAARTTVRGLLDFAEREPVPLDDVEPAANIVRRFVTGAMSFGSLSKEAHEMLAHAMNRIGGRSNSGEGGEEPERYGTERNSAIKQVASARFGVTAEYLVNARELQIKIAQGAKPGEGGQLPGHKVDATIARTRYATPGVTLISPPPHHDIYSIEDLAQLVFDLKNVNPRAAVSVKLVAEVGVGTVAAGVAKARADLIVISGDSGGTGASPLSSIKHAGIPWELGLAEAHQTLVLNDLRGRVRLQTDGQLKTGRDVVVAALLGAEEFGFATAPLVVGGCVMMRKCHLNTCPVGIATQDPVLRAKFKGQPDHVVEYFFFVAEEARRIMARLGFRRMDDMIGRTDALRPADLDDHWKARTLDLSPLLFQPAVAPDAARRYACESVDLLVGALDHELIAAAGPALESRAPVRASFDIRNRDRSVGAMLSGEIARRLGGAGLPADTIRFHFTGSAGQSFGAFCASGVTLVLDGEANDHVGKGLSGGRLVVRAPSDAGFDPATATLVGNVALYGATGGELYVAGGAGERFAVRNSGAVAVVEGVGDHGCEYMTGGVVVVLGGTGRNFAAGMSGGVAFVLDDDGTLAGRCNLALVELEPAARKSDLALVRRLVRQHLRHTGSQRARRILQDWDAVSARFVRVMPTEYRRVLEQREREAREGRERERRARTAEHEALGAAAAEQRQTRRSGDGRPERLPDHPTGGAAAAAGGRADHHVAGVLRAGVG
ncbi:ferredoxin-dependent glutamate synthase [Gemmatirosa kalamazoonensis]|uniref:Glutamate synthase [NADPH] large chain n=1 Tax=Gemmatirosa kalamazoonensis TaxID=861299 RepID=W0RHS9_9BACT|nr:glutamate synthase large subunit [Gemmatirosa kalamazoonensis]AHG89885.1 ferredoxin-dependent glutamate synthase [Gemmatirosa kalamazoonensis]